MSFTVSSLKTFPYGWDWRRVWTLSISHIPSPLECLPSSIWTFGLRVWFAPRHFQILFFQSHPTFFHCIYLFSKKCLPRNALLWSWCIQSDGLRLESRWIFYCVIPWLVDVVYFVFLTEVGYYLLIILCLSRQFLSFLKQGRIFCVMFF